jgi:hypothetical protein
MNSRVGNSPSLSLRNYLTANKIPLPQERVHFLKDQRAFVSCAPELAQGKN